MNLDEIRAERDTEKDHAAAGLFYPRPAVDGLRSTWGSLYNGGRGLSESFPTIVVGGRRVESAGQEAGENAQSQAAWAEDRF